MDRNESISALVQHKLFFFHSAMTCNPQERVLRALRRRVTMSVEDTPSLQMDVILQGLSGKSDIYTLALLQHYTTRNSAWRRSLHQLQGRAIGTQQSTASFFKHTRELLKQYESALRQLCSLSFEDMCVSELWSVLRTFEYVLKPERLALFASSFCATSLSHDYLQESLGPSAMSSLAMVCDCREDAEHQLRLDLASSGVYEIHDHKTMKTIHAAAHRVMRDHANNVIRNLGVLDKALGEFQNMPIVQGAVYLLATSFVPFCAQVIQVLA